jgi:hypothetical protein
MTRSLTSEPWSRILDPRYAPDHAFLLNASTEVLHADLYAAPIGLYEPSQQPHCSKTRKALCGSVQVEQGHRADAERIRAGIEQCWHPASCGIGTISPTSRFVRKCAPPPPSGAVMVMFLIQADSPCLARSGVCVCVSHQFALARGQLQADLLGATAVVTADQPANRSIGSSDLDNHSRGVIHGKTISPDGTVDCRRSCVDWHQVD